MENKDKNLPPILSKATKISILIFAIVISTVSIFDLYLGYRQQIRQQTMCNEIAILNAQIPPADINSYLIRKISFENVCMKKNGMGSYFWTLASIVFLGYAINLLRGKNNIDAKNKSLPLTGAMSLTGKSEK